MKQALLIIFFLVVFGCGDGSMSDQSPTGGDIRVFADRYEFRGDIYDSLSQLEAALDAVPDISLTLSLSDCASDDRVAQVAGILQRRNQANVAFLSFSEGCK